MGRALLWEAAPRLVEVIQPWLLWFICHFVVTVFTFLQESPGRFYNIVTKTQSCADSFPRLKISLPQSQRCLHHWGKVLCKPRDGNQWSLIFHRGGASFPLVQCLLIHAPSHIRTPSGLHIRVSGGSLGSLAFCSPGRASENSRTWTSHA